MTDHFHSVVIPAGACARFPLEFCDTDLEEAYGLQVNVTAEGECEMERWLVPGACILPTPVEVLIPLGRWERTSEKLVVNERAKEAIRWVGGVKLRGQFV